MWALVVPVFVAPARRPPVRSPGTSNGRQPGTVGGPPSLSVVSERFDAIVVGSGPNGLTAAIHLARQSLSVLVLEGHDEIGGGTRTGELTLPGFHHDVCSAAHPFAAASPYLSQLPLQDHGLEWITAPVAMAHPMDDGTAAMLHNSVDDTTGGLGADGDTYRRLMEPLARHGDDVIAGSLAPLIRVPRHPVTMARFGLPSLQSAERLARRFATPNARALMGGLAAHAVAPLDRAATAGVGIALAVAAHHGGWPIAAGGSSALTSAMASYFTGLGGEIRTGTWVRRLTDLPPTDAILLDVAPAGFLAMAGERLPLRSRRRLGGWRYGPAAFKMDYALDAPIPWTAPGVDRAPTVHLGGTFEEIAAGEKQIWGGRPADAPFVIVTQPSLFDPSRAPAGKHTAWAYCHVPANFDGDASAAIDSQIERFAPGFGDTIIGRHRTTPLELEAYNPNNVHGTISGGAVTLRQLVGRPRFSPFPHRTAIDGVYLCSAATAPGAGTHGMCGFHAAETALHTTFRGR